MTTTNEDPWMDGLSELSRWTTRTLRIPLIIILYFEAGSRTPILVVTYVWIDEKEKILLNGILSEDYKLSSFFHHE